MEKFKVGTLVLERKYLVEPTVYRDWRCWAIGCHGGVALMKAIEQLKGKNLSCSWYGAHSDPHNPDYTDTPTKQQFTFCGSIEGTTITFDIGKEIGHVDFYKVCNPIEVEIEQDSMGVILQQVLDLLAKNG